MSETSLPEANRPANGVRGGKSDPDAFAYTRVSERTSQVFLMVVTGVILLAAINKPEVLTHLSEVMELMILLVLMVGGGPKVHSGIVNSWGRK